MSGISGRLLAAVVVCVGLGGCTAGVPSPAGSAASSSVLVSQPTSAPEPATERPRFAPAVQEPRDARGVDVCNLLTPAQVDELGLERASALPEVSGTARVCSWAYMTGRDSAGLTVATERSIPGLDGIFLQKDGYVLFEPVTLGGHPGFRADQDAGDCTLYIAIADYQLMSVDGSVRGTSRPDSCAQSRRMGEMVLSNLPLLGD